VGRRQRGFTFVEISVVLVALVLMALIMGPRLISMQNTQRVESFRLDSERIFRSARSLALSRRQDMEVRWDNGLTVGPAVEAAVEEEEPEEGEEPEARADQAQAPEGLIEFERAIANGEEQSEGDWVIRFTAAGASDAGGIQFSSNGRSFWVRTDAQGRIEAGGGELEAPGLSEWDAGDLEQRIDAGQ
jgi:prepilin-type N-terminal cleavage/methylation domain-containing protein